MGLWAGANICPRTDRQEDGVLEPALSENWTDRQMAAQSRHQLSVPGQIGPHEVTLLSSPVVLEPAGDFQESTKDQGAWTRTERLRPWEGVPGAASTPCPGSGVAVAALSSERNLAGWPDIQAIPKPRFQALGHQHPLVAIPHPDPHLPENCPKALRRIRASPSTLPPDLPPLRSQPCAPGGPAPHHCCKDWGTFLPKKSRDRASGRPSSFQLWVAIQTTGAEVAKPCRQDWGEVSGPQAPPHPSQPAQDRGPTGTHPSPCQISSLGGM